MFPIAEAALPLSSGRSVYWRSPLSADDAGRVLERNGADRVSEGEAGTEYVLAVDVDPFGSALSVVVAPSGRGTRIVVSLFQRGFGRDFDRAVRGGLTVFALALLAFFATEYSGLELLRSGVAVGLGWSAIMGSFAGLRWLMTAVGGQDAALDEACRRMRRVLFATR